MVQTAKVVTAVASLFATIAGLSVAAGSHDRGEALSGLKQGDLGEALPVVVFIASQVQHPSLSAHTRHGAPKLPGPILCLAGWSPQLSLPQT